MADKKKKMKGDDPCWDGYEMIGTKKKDGKTVPNCVREEMTEAEKKKKEEIVKSMKDKAGDFKKRYGDDWKSVMYATASKMAQEDVGYSEGLILAEASIGAKKLRDIEGMDDLDAIKKAAMQIISDSRTNDRKKAALKQNIKSKSNKNQILSLLWNALLSGEKMGTTTSKYAKAMKEGYKDTEIDAFDDEDIEDYDGENEYMEYDNENEPDEQEITNNHEVETMDYPVDDSAARYALKGKDKSRDADYMEDEDEAEYDEWNESRKYGKAAILVEKVRSRRQALTEQEVFKKGILSFEDGGTVMVSESDARALNDLKKSLNKSNRQKMMEKLQSNLDEYKEIVKFARAVKD